jgi:hypothetical protein
MDGIMPHLDALSAQLPLDLMKHAVRDVGDGLTISLTTIIRNAVCISPVKRRIPDHTLESAILYIFSVFLL